MAQSLFLLGHSCSYGESYGRQSGTPGQASRGYHPRFLVLLRALSSWHLAVLNIIIDLNKARWRDLNLPIAVNFSSILTLRNAVRHHC